MNIEFAFFVTPPDGRMFRAVVVEAGEGLRVLSNASGVWAAETRFGVADLIMPEQDLDEWDVEEVDATTVGDLPLTVDEFNEADHPREPAGSPEGGQFGGGAGEMSREEKDMVLEYTRTGGTYGPVNEALRAGRDPGEHSKTIAAMDRAMDLHGRDITKEALYRGIAGYDPEELGLEPGREFEDKGFVSTARTLKSAKVHALGGADKLEDEAVGMMIKINGADRGLDMDSWSRYGEDETVLPRGRKFRVMSVKRGIPGKSLHQVSLKVIK